MVNSFSTKSRKRKVFEQAVQETSKGSVPKTVFKFWEQHGLSISEQSSSGSLQGSANFCINCWIGEGVDEEVKSSIVEKGDKGLVIWVDLL